MNLDSIGQYITNLQANICNLVAALGLGQPVSVVYTDLDGVTSVRLIQPNAIVKSANGQTTVEAYDLNRQEARNFRVDAFEFVGAPGDDLAVVYA